MLIKKFVGSDAKKTANEAIAEAHSRIRNAFILPLQKRRLAGTSGLLEDFFHSNDSGIARSSVSLEEILRQQAIINGDIDDDDYQYDYYDYFDPDLESPETTMIVPVTGLT